MKQRNYLAAAVMISIVFLVRGKDVPELEEKIEHAHVGNYALPVSQQPAPFISFGEFVIDKGDLLFYIRGQQTKGRKELYAEVAPSIVYGISDSFSIYIELPIEVKQKYNGAESHGTGDVFVQFEKLVYASETKTAATEMTVVVSVGAPTGSAHKDPPTGFGAANLFFGLTASHTNKDWYFFSSLGVDLTGAHKNTKYGNQFFYEVGMSRNISYRTDKWILNWTVEFDGRYLQRDTLSGVVDCNSGGNTLLLGPSLWFSTQRLILQLGASGIVSQHLFGCQIKEQYYLAAIVGWKF